MNLNQKFSLFLWLGIVTCFQSFAQRDTITTDKLIIVKQYSPTVNDAFKIKQRPSEKDTIIQQRQTITYSFIDVPVASTFTPAKGTASGVRMAPPEKLFENYARFGAGNYATILADFYSNFDLNRERNLDIKFSHISSQGGIDDVVLDDDFSDTSLGLNLKSKDRYFEWNAGIDLNHREVNYYGLSESTISSLFDEQINSIDPNQTYTKLSAFGGIEFYDQFLKLAEVKVQNFTDNYSSSEQLLEILPLVEIPLRNQTLSIQGDLNLLNGSFERSLFGNTEIDYQQLQAGVNPFVNLNYENLSLKLGAKAVYFNDLEASSSDVFFYPDLEAEFLLNQETVKINLGVNGGLQQNTYENLSSQNPFVSPTLLIRPSDQQYNAFAGFSTKLLNNLSLSAQANYSSTSDFALFRSNPDLENLTVVPAKRNFDYQNSFDVIYNDLDILSISADLAYQIESEFTIGFYGKYSNFSTEEGEEAWNLPEVELKAYANYDFTKNWNFSASLFYIGNRTDALENVVVDSSGLPTTSGLVNTTVDGFLDINASVEYKINPRLSAFINANNLLSNSYNRWQNFEVQGLQILGGLIYQFDW
jgi:hypothetical protein